MMSAIRSWRGAAAHMSSSIEADAEDVGSAEANVQAPSRKCEKRLDGDVIRAQFLAMASFQESPSARSSGNLIADRRFAWGEAAARDDDAATAVDLFEQTLELAPDWAPAWLALGEARQKLGDIDRAAMAFARAAELDPAGDLGAGLRLAALGQAPAPMIAPAGYVRDLFDQYAGRFDAHLVGSLAYRGPEILRGAVARARGEVPFSVMLDLGCGTGLAARAFAPLAGVIDGVDLSPAMIAQARKTGLYRTLVAGDLLAFLDQYPDGGADLIVAADVFVYVGALEAVIAACARVLAPGGLLAFSAQRTECALWALGADLRYAHSADYLRALAGVDGLDVALLEPVSTRKDAGADVPGLVCVMARP